MSTQYIEFSILDSIGSFTWERSKALAPSISDLNVGAFSHLCFCSADSRLSIEFEAEVFHKVF